MPGISEALAKHDDQLVSRRTNVAMRIANVITIPSFMGMCVIATPISSMLYATPDSGPCIAVMSFGVFLLGIQQVTTGVLQGMGYTAIPFINMAVSAAVKVFLSWNLTALPAWGILGAAWATNADFGVAALLNLFFLYKFIGYKMDVIHTIKLFLSAGVMGAAVYASYLSAFRVLHSNTLSTLAAILVGALVYGIMMIAVRAIRPDDVRGIPHIGGKLAAVIEKVDSLRKKGN